MTEQEKEAAVKHSFEYWKATVRDVNREFFNEQLDQYGNVKALEEKLRVAEKEIISRGDNFNLIKKKLEEVEENFIEVNNERMEYWTRLEIATDAIVQICSNYSIPDYERSVLREALEKIRTSNGGVK